MPVLLLNIRGFSTYLVPDAPVAWIIQFQFTEDPVKKIWVAWDKMAPQFFWGDFNALVVTDKIHTIQKSGYCIFENDSHAH